MLQDVERSVAVLGAAGTGKTTALLAAQRALAGSALVAPIDAERWLGLQPGTQKSALDIVRGAVCRAVQRVIEADPQRVAALTRLQGTFLRWLLQKELRPRALGVWREQVRSMALESFFAQPYEDLYPDQADPDDVRGQIEEMVHLAQGLNLDVVAITLDAPAALSAENVSAVGQLFGWLDLWQHPCFVLKAVLTPGVATGCELEKQVRGRVVVRHLRWAPEKHDAILQRHLVFLGDEQELVVDSAVVPAVAEAARTVLVDIFGELSPRSATCLAETMLDTLQQASPTPDEGYVELLQRELYGRFAPLRIERKRLGVWRGERFIPLAERPFRAFEVLWDAKGDDTWTALMDVAGSKENIHTLIKRIREAVEPFPKIPLYVCRIGGETYRLEHTAPR